jgi:hypothetical protein
MDTYYLIGSFAVVLKLLAFAEIAFKPGRNLVPALRFALVVGFIPIQTAQGS